MITRQALHYSTRPLQLRFASLESDPDDAKPNGGTNAYPKKAIQVHNRACDCSHTLHSCCVVLHDIRNCCSLWRWSWRALDNMADGQWRRVSLNPKRRGSYCPERLTKCGAAAGI